MPNLGTNLKNRLDGRFSTTVTSDGVATVGDSNVTASQLDALIRDCKAAGHTVSLVAGVLTIKNA